MAIQISPPRDDVAGLAELEPLWTELHRHHREVSEYTDLVADPALSWARRLGWYRSMLADGASYLTATDAAGRLVGYAMIRFDEGEDDTFAGPGGTAEVVTLVVTDAERSRGLGRALLGAAESVARERGYGTVRIGVMAGNARAQRFYEASGYAVGEHILYRRIGDP